MAINASLSQVPAELQVTESTSAILRWIIIMTGVGLSRCGSRSAVPANAIQSAWGGVGGVERTGESMQESECTR